MRRFLKSCLSIVLATSLVLSSGSMSLAVNAAEIENDAVVESTTAELEENVAVSKDAAVADVVAQGEPDPDAKMDVYLEDGIHEISTVDTSKFIDEDTINKVSTDFIPARFDTMTKNGGDASKTFWDSNRENGWVVGAGRYTWLQVDATSAVEEILSDPEYADYNFVQANVNVTNKYSRTAGDVNNVRYIPDNSWTSASNEDAGGKALTYDNSLTFFDAGTDVGYGKVSGSGSAMKTTTIPADGISRFDISKNNYLVSVVVYGGGTGADIASSYLTEANNYNQPLVAGYQPSLQLVYSNAGQQQVEYLTDRPYALDKIRAIISEYDNSDISSNFTPIGDENGVTVTYSVNDTDSQQWISAEPGKISVTRPTQEQGNQSVVLTVTAQRNNVIFTYDINMTVLAQQGASPYAEDSLNNVIAFAEETIAEQKAANNIAESEGVGEPGQLSPDKLDALETLIVDAKAATSASAMANYVKLLVSSGTEFMSSGIISNEILYKTKNKYLDSGTTLVYSEDRAYLQGLVWKAKATLLVDEELYPKSAKKALQVEIDRAELALQVDEDGTSMLKLPFAKTRMFYAQPDDSMIKWATKQSTMFHNYGNSDYGLEPVLAWYATDNVLYSGYSTVEVEPTFAGYVRNSSPTAWEGTKIVIGKSPDDRIGMFQFDLSSIEGAIQSAQVRLVATNTNQHASTIYLEEDYYTNNQPTWNQMVEKNGAYVEPGVGVVSGNKIGTYKPTGKDNYSYGDITDAAIGEAAKDGIVTFSIQIDVSTTYANDIYGSANASNVTQLPTLIVKTSDVGLNSLRDYSRKVIDNQKDLLLNATTYSGDVKNAEIGSFRKAEHDAAIAALNKAETALKGTKIYEIAEATVDFLDAAYDCRMTIALMSDIDVDENGNPKGNIFFTGEEVEELKKRIKTDDALKRAYQNLVDGIKTVSLDVSQDYWDRWIANDLTLFEENPSFANPPASTGGKYVTGRHVKDTSGNELPTIMPSGHTYTGKAYITIELGSGDNDTTGYKDLEGTGLGEAWIDDIGITLDDGNIAEVPNSGFETAAIDNSGRPLYWTVETTGNGEGRWIDDRKNAASGNRSIYLHNPDGNSTVTWKSEPFKLETADGLDVTWRVQQYGIFEEKGPVIKFHFITEKADGTKSEVVSAGNYYNGKTKPTVTGHGGYTLTMQRAALLAMLADNETDRIYYAKLAKVYINFYLDEFNQGIQTWIHQGSRPDGADAFGAVQGGRGAGSLATAWSIVKNMTIEDGKPLFTDEEKEVITENAYYLMRDLNDIRDRYHLTYEEAAFSGSNWSSDMNMGAAMLGLAFVDTMDNAKAHMFNGIRIDEAMLLVNIGDDGSWPESVRYHNAAVSKLAVLAKCLRASTKIYDWFANEDLEFYKAFDYLTWIQTPTYANGNASTPFFGDHNLSSGDELYMCGLYYDEIVDSHPDVALRMYGTWMNAGNPVPALSGDDNHIQSLFGHTKDINDYGDYTEAMKEIGSTDYAFDYGNYIFRNDFMEKGSETYLVAMIQDDATGHNHRDQLSFIMYADNVPLVIDPGSSPSYWGGAKSNYIGNTQHSLVAFDRDGKGNYIDTHDSSTFRGFYTSDSLDVVRGKTINRENTSQELYRDIAFVKNGFEAFVVWDQVTAATYGTMMNLPLYTRSKNAITHDGNKFTAKMFGGIDLEITYLEGNYETYEVVTYNANGSYIKREDEDNPKVDHLRIRNQGDDDYLTVLFPKTKARGSLTTEELADGVYKLSHSTGNSVYLVLNNGVAAKTITLPENNLIDMETLNDAEPTVYTDGTVTLAKNSMKILTSKVTTTDEAEAAGTGTPTETPVPSQPGNTIGTATPGANAGGGAPAGPSGSGNTDTPDDSDGNVDGSVDVDLKDADTAVDVYRNLATGQKAKIAYDVTDDVTVEFASSNKKVATVSSKGVIKAKKSGKAAISVLVTKNGVTQKVTITVKVKDKKKVPTKVRKLGKVRVTKAGTPVITVTKDMKVSGKSKLVVAKKDGVTLSYTSSDKTVATVNKNGKITGKSVGTANIVANVKYNGVIQKYLVEVTVK